MTEDEENQQQLRALLNQRLQDAKDLREFFKQENYAALEGKTGLLCKVAAEEKFLEKFTNPAKPQPLEKKFLETSNLISLLNLVKEIPNQQDVTAVLKTFALNHPDIILPKLKVDIVAEKGKCWIKVISRSPKGIASDWVTGNGKNIFEQADDYLLMASALKQVERPRIVFIFCSGITDKMAGKLERKGIEVRGQQFPQDSIMKLSEDFEEELEQDDDLYFENDEKMDNVLVNLDVSAVFVLISNLTHRGGCEKQLISTLLTQQAKDEREIKAREQLLAEIGEREMIITRTAYNAVQDILSTVAGPQERKRAEELFQQVRIIEDNMSPRVAKLQATERISERCKVIFGTGDSYRAITATANKHCVSSALSQGVSFDVIIHPSRALSEKKEVGYVGPR